MLYAMEDAVVVMVVVRGEHESVASRYWSMGQRNEDGVKVFRT